MTFFLGKQKQPAEVSIEILVRIFFQLVVISESLQRDKKAAKIHEKMIICSLPWRPFFTFGLSGETLRGCHEDVGEGSGDGFNEG